MRFILPSLSALLLAMGLVTGKAAAQVFEVIHPDVEKGGFEFGSLNGIVLDNLETGEERSAHEVALGYAPFSFWKTKFAIEIVNPEGEDAEYEGFEWENVLLFPLGQEGANHSHGHDHDNDATFDLGALGLFFALEVPNDGGIDSGAAEFGPLIEFSVAPVTSVLNLFSSIRSRTKRIQASSMPPARRFQLARLGRPLLIWVSRPMVASKALLETRCRETRTHMSLDPRSTVKLILVANESLSRVSLRYSG
jgi:hypothetical protein